MSLAPGGRGDRSPFRAGWRGSNRRFVPIEALKVIALVDGEHYPDVTRWGLATARAAGSTVLAALLVGGVEKLDRAHHLDVGDVPVLRGEAEPMRALRRAIEDLRPDAVLDLSDEPVLGYERRMELVAVALALGVPYLGPDFRFDPPIREALLAVPTLAVIGTGKRVAKTGVSSHVARLASSRHLRPAIVAMGRGGPAEPTMAGPQDVTLAALLERARRGEHAASDYLEDALTAGVPTVGARRVGGGFAGMPFATNVAQAAALAVADGAGTVILEGSGASMPTVPWDAGVLVAPASLPIAHLAGYAGPLRLLLSDLLVFMLGGGLSAGPEHLSILTSHARRLVPDIRVAVAELQPVALGDVKDKDAFFVTTARGGVADRLAERLERTSGCRIVKVSDRLADRAALDEDLRTAPPFDVLLTELKAAAVDVAAEGAVARGADVVFVDNRPVAARGAPADGELDDLLAAVLDLAARRAAERI
jgi:cyclic 2,3-diphosphoglycerate synthetase